MEAFINEEIPFTDIPVIIRHCLEGQTENLISSFEEIEEYDKNAREKALQCIRAVNT